MKRILFLGIALCHLGTFAQEINLGSLKKEAGNSPIRYVSVGSVLSAGIRDGGVFEAGQKTSFPALLAIQLGIENFKQPLIPDNGTGFKKVSVDKYGVLKFQETKGLNDSERNVRLPEITDDIDNLAIPYQKVFDIFESDETKANPLYDNRSYRHLKRYAKGQGKIPSYFDLVRSKQSKIDFFTFEFGLHDFVQFIQAGGYGSDITFISERESVGEDKLLKLLTQSTSKGVILNVPDYLKFPIFRRYSLSKLASMSNQPQLYVEHWQKTHVREAKQGDIFLSKGSVIKLIENGNIGSFDNPVKDEDVFDVEEQRFASPIGYNVLLTKLSEKYDLPIVDIYTLYNSILDGEYVAEEGITVDISYPGGNFFSNDGITPTALGQAIITNEIIKVINKSYGANISLLSLKKFL